MIIKTTRTDFRRACPVLVFIYMLSFAPYKTPYDGRYVEIFIAFYR